MNLQDKVLVSIIIPSYNRRNELRYCLTGVFSQQQSRLHVPSFNVIVFDNGSEDGTLDMLGKEFPAVNVLKSVMNIGASRARNEALKIISAKYVWFLDSDSVIDNCDCLVRMVEIMETHEDIGSIGGELIRYAEGTVLKRNKILLNGEPGSDFLEPKKVKLIDCDFLATCNCLTRRELVLKIGGFDPVYFFLCEDRELGFKIKKQGYRNVCDYSTAVLHNISFAQERSIFLKCRNSFRFALKNLPLWQILILPFSTLCIRISGFTLRQLKKENPIVLKYVPGNRLFITRVLILGTKYILAIFWAFLWNFWYLPETLKARFNRENYL
ncbi:MAG: glycosyltransferase [Candidatus Omnitrophota bacterium]